MINKIHINNTEIEITKLYQMKKTYPYSINKQDLIKKIKDLTDISNDEKAYLIELVNTKKKHRLEGARRRNETLGRPKGISKETLEKYQYAKYLYDNKKLSIDKACKQAGISKTTFYRVEKNINR